MAKTGITKWFGKQVFTLVTKANVAAMQKAAFVVEADVKTHFTLQGSGRKYTRRGIEHIASMKGQPPAIDTGILRSSIMSDVEVVGMNVIGKVGPDVELLAAKTPVGTDIKYGLYLEVGTVNMSPRPFLRPALKRTARKVKQIFKQANK